MGQLVGGEGDRSLDSASVGQLVGGEDDLLFYPVSAGFLPGGTDVQIGISDLLP